MTRFLKSAAAALALTLLTGAGAQAAGEHAMDGKKNAVSLDVIGFLYGGVSLGFEHKLTPKSSVTAQLFFYTNSAGYVSTTILAVGGGYRMYLPPDFLTPGLYWEPFASIGSETIKIDVFGLK